MLLERRVSGAGVVDMAVAVAAEVGKSPFEGAEVGGVDEGIYDGTCGTGWVTGLGELSDPDCGEYPSPVPHGPNFAYVRANVCAASSGSSIFHLSADIFRILKVRRAHSQLSPISSRCLTPWIMSLFAFFSGRFRR
jgi:hypothetical protein